MVGNVGDLGWRNILPKTFFNKLSADGRESGSGDAELGLPESFCSDGADRVFACEKRVKRFFSVEGGVDVGGVRGDQADCS